MAKWLSITSLHRMYREKVFFAYKCTANVALQYHINSVKHHVCERMGEYLMLSLLLAKL